MVILPNDNDILEQFRTGSVDVLPDNEKATLWRRIERNIGKYILLSRFYKWSAAACIALLLSIGYIWYNSNSRTPAFKMLIVETQPQQKQKLLLPDSTVVWLNADSRLEYPENFSDHRVVYLEGEAYFVVAHDEAHPFTIHAHELEVTVLGTILNVAAYQSETEVVTTLVEGKIALHMNGDQLQRTILMPNQQVVFNKNSRNMMFETVNPELFTSWVKGYYKFENASFEQIAKYFERVHGKAIRFGDESLKTLCFTGTFLQEQDAMEVLELLREIRDFHYTIQREQIIIINNLNIAKP